jgi:outer membrane protein assembly factor BamB
MAAVRTYESLYRRVGRCRREHRFLKSLKWTTAAKRSFLIVETSAVVSLVLAAVITTSSPAAVRILHRQVSQPSLVAESSSQASPSSGLNWPAYLFGPTHSSDDSATTAITTANASSLTEVWNYVPTGTKPLGSVIYSSPVVYDGQVYIGSQNGMFYDLNETTGGVVWSQYAGQQPQTTCTGTDTGGQGFTSTATVATDPQTGQPTVYVAAPNGYLYAWNATTGQKIWRSVVNIPSKKVNNYFNWSSPTVANGMIYVGISSNCDSPLVQGGEKVYDQATGKHLATFHTTHPRDIGGSIWSSAAVDPAGSVYVTTGNPNFSGGAPGYSESIVRLNPDTLAPEDYWTLPASQQAFDGDFGASPVIWTADLSDGPTEMVGACNKNGTFYALQASDLAAGPVWQYKIGNYLYGECIAAAVWDQVTGQLFVSGNQTTIDGTGYYGSVREADPATGAFTWQTGLPGEVLGTPTLDGSGVMAVPTVSTKSGEPSAVYLLNASNGDILATVNTNDMPVFSQPVFADGYLIVATVGGGITAYKPTSS